MTAPICPHCKIPCAKYNGQQRLPVIVDGKLMTHVQELWTCADPPQGCGSTKVGRDWIEDPKPGEWETMAAKWGIA